MDNRVIALVSGSLATPAMFSFLWVADAFTRYRLRTHLTFAGLLDAPPTVGLPLLAIGGIVLFPLGFFLIGEHLAPDSEAMRGVVFSLILWIFFVLVFLPTVGLVGSLLFVLFSHLGHLIYGSVLGWTFGWLDGEHSSEIGP